jgi:hypothetical protein
MLWRLSPIELIRFGMERLGMTNHKAVTCSGCCAGHRLGSLVAARLSGRDVEFGMCHGAAGWPLAFMLHCRTRGAVHVWQSSPVGFSAGLS